MNRRKRRRIRLMGQIKHYLFAHRGGEWTSNRDILTYLEHSARGRVSRSSISAIALGQLLKSVPEVEHEVQDVLGRKVVFYRYIAEEE